MDRIIRVLGIDPGINNTGYCLGLIDTETGIITVKDYNVFSSSTVTKKKYKDDFKNFGSVVCHHYYSERITDIIETLKPDYVVSEDAFINPRMPRAYGSLLLCISIIRNVLYRKFKKKLFTVAPKEAKRAVAEATADKLAIQESIHKLDDLVIKHTAQKPQETMCEHEADSVAILYAFCKKTLRSLIISEQDDTPTIVESMEPPTKRKKKK